MRDGIAIAGNIFVDYIKKVDVFPRKGMLANILEESVGVGGCVCNTILDLACIDPGLPLTAIGCVGEDESYRFIKGLFEKHGIDNSGIKTLHDVPTGYTDVIYAQSDSTRTFFNYCGANRSFDIKDIPFGILEARILHMGYALLLERFDSADPEYGTVMARALSYAQAQGIKTSLDVVSEDSERFSRIVTPALRYCDFLIINEVEGSLVTGIPVRGRDGAMLEEGMCMVCERLMELGVSDSVVIHSPEGGFLFNESGYYTMPALRLPVEYIRGTVGAGDAFAAGALYGFYNGWKPLEVLRLANCSAAANLASADSISGAKPLVELLTLYEKYK